LLLGFALANSVISLYMSPEAMAKRDVVWAQAQAQAELQWRISQPISLLLLGMLAIPLARTLPRQGKYTKLAMGIAIYFLYGNAVGVMQTLIERGEVSTTIGIWPVHLVIALIVASLLYVQSSGRVPKPRRRDGKVQEA
jgi:lipopolysaccharide export system permease protein